MKKIMFIDLLTSCNFLATLLCMLACLQSPAQKTGASPADETAIKKIIAAETEAYARRDSTLLISFYTDDPVTQSAWNSPDGSFGTYKGFARIRKNFSDAFRTAPRGSHQPIERSEWFFRQLGEGWIWVNFIEKETTVEGKLHTNYETRLMKREGSGWKIAVMFALSDHGVPPHNP